MGTGTAVTVLLDPYLLTLSPQVLSTKRVLYFVNLSPRDYLRHRSAAHPAIQAVQQAVENLSGGAVEDTEVSFVCD